MSLPKTWMEFSYLVAKECATPIITSLCTLAIVVVIAQNVDTEWWAVGGAGGASLIGQVIRKRMEG